MDQKLFQRKITQLKKRIIHENKDNHSSRRTFSKKLKTDMINFIIVQSLGSSKAAKLLGVSVTAISKWKKEYTSSAPFKQIDVQIAPSLVDRDESSIEISGVRSSLSLVTALITLLICERLLVHIFF